MDLLRLLTWRNLALLLGFLLDELPDFQGGRKGSSVCQAKGSMSMTDKVYYPPNQSIGEINHLKRSLFQLSAQGFKLRKMSPHILSYFNRG